MSILHSLALLLAAQGGAPQEPPVTTGSDQGSALRLQLSGHVDPRYVNRSNSLELTGSTLNAFALPAGPSDFWTGRIGLRADIEVKDYVRGVLEIENRSLEQGMNKAFGASPPDTAVQFRQGYVEAGEFLVPHLNLRIGVQNVTLRNRPHDDPFFMDLGESEGFYSGMQGTGNFIGNTTDRDQGQAVGIRALYSPFEVMTVQAFWMRYGQSYIVDPPAPHPDTVVGLVVNSLVAEHWSAWLMFTLVSGMGARRGEVGTLGLGIDGYLGDSKELELFAEGYLQGGALQTSVRVAKEAYAYTVGARYMVCSCNKLWIEGAYSRRSGDRQPGDGTDQAFQSYENSNRFLIMESAEFGLDIDTDVSCLRAAVGLGPFDVAGRPLRFQVDVGRFLAATPIQSVPVAGAALNWGIETDLAVTWNYNESLSLWLKGAWLADSDLVFRMAGANSAWLLVFGTDFKF